MKKICREIMQWAIAMSVSMLVVSCLCFFYYRQTGWLERSGNATSAIWEPNTMIVNMVEGAGIVAVDENGYTNPPGAVLAEEIVLCMGASYTQAKEVMLSDRYTTILNDMLSEDGTLKVYNLSRDAMFFAEMVRGVEAAVQEFPQTKVLVLETGNLDIAVEQLEKAVVQREYKEEQRGKELIDTLSTKERIKFFIKDYFPILGVLKYQLSLLNEGDAKTGNDVTIDEDAYRIALSTVFDGLNTIFDGQIIILYHPMVSLEDNGDMVIDDSKVLSIFEDCCEEYGISFVDVGDDFQEDYEKNAHVPYGFFNTTMGTGHINKWGHKVIAEALYEEIAGGAQ